MTLILTWLTNQGVVMAADSALTTKVPGQAPHVQNSAVCKVHWSEKHKVGVSAYGRWDIDGTKMDRWLPATIEASNAASHNDLADELALKLTHHHGKNGENGPRAGVHLVGYVPHGTDMVPEFYHIHDGPTQEGWCAPAVPWREEFAASKDVDGDRFKSDLVNGGAIHFRNGDYHKFAVLQDLLHQLLAEFANQGFVIPHCPDLARLAEYVVFQLRLISELYRMSNVVPGIGGRIDCIAFDRTGLVQSTASYR